jgi:drug/metabolite transporter (DMT)-like permease
MADQNRTEARAVTGTILALTAAVAFALTNAAASLAFHGGSNPVTLAAFRFVLPALVLMIWLSAERRALRLPGRDGLVAVVLGALTAGYSLALLSAIGAIPLALAILIFYLFPLVATVILGLFGWEKLGWKTIAAIVVAFIGLVLALDPRVGNVSIEGLAFGFAAAFGLGIVVAVSSRVFRSGDSRPATLYIATVAAIALIVFCVQQGDLALPSTATGWTGFVAAMLFYAFAMIAFFIAVSMIGPARTSLLSYVEPIVSAGLGIALLGEALTLMQIGGIVLMVGALAAATMLKQLGGT